VSKGEGLLLYFGAVPNQERDFLPESLHCWRNGVLVGRPGGRGALGWNFSGAAGRGAALIFRMVVGTSRSAFLFGVVSTPGEKKCSWDWFEMFHMFIHICIYVFFSGICI
jgi:hypothetical protein